MRPPGRSAVARAALNDPLAFAEREWCRRDERAKGPSSVERGSDMRRLALHLLGVVAMLAPGAAAAQALTIEGFYGVERPPATDFSAAVSGVTSSSLFDSALQMAGGDVLLRLSVLELGVIGDTTFGSDRASQAAIGGLAGIAFGESTRLDLLAEAGGHAYGNLAHNPDFVVSSSTQWLFYVGLRPGISFKLGDGPLSLGLWGFARWDVTSHDLPVTLSSVSTGNAGTYKLGGTTIGLTLRLGLVL